MAENIAKLKWRCRRGMKELDVLLNKYLEGQYSGASEYEQNTFHLLLEQEDPHLYAWFLGRSKSENEDLQALVEKIGQSAN